MKPTSKLFLGLLVLAALLLGVICNLATPTFAQSTNVVTLLHISDTHSHLAPWGPKQITAPYSPPRWIWDDDLHRYVKENALEGTLGGLSRAAAIVTLEKARNNQALFVHAGDFMDGDLFFNETLGASELQILKSVGLDAMVLGNHDFRFGPDFLVDVFNDAWSKEGVPILGTNLDPSTSSLGSRIVPTLVKEVNGVKVGIFGLTPPNGALASPKPAKILPYLTIIAPEAVSLLRASGAQVIVCLAHIGMTASRELAVKVPGIDVIVNGHDNAILSQPEEVAYPGGTTLIVSAGNYYGWVGRLRLAVNGNQVRLLTYDLLTIDDSAPSVAFVDARIKHLQKAIVARYGNVFDQQIAFANTDITATWISACPRRNTGLGDLFTDAYRSRTGTDIALEAIGYLGDPLPRGPINADDIFRAMSYGTPASMSGEQIVNPWHLITFRAAGAAITTALNTTLTLGGDYFPQVSGITLDYNSSAKGQKILSNTVMVGGSQIDPLHLYTVTTTEGVYGALKSLKLPMQDVQVLPITAFDATRNYATVVWRLDQPTSSRIRDIGVTSVASQTQE